MPIQHGGALREISAASHGRILDRFRAYGAKRTHPAGLNRTFDTCAAKRKHRSQQ
jgi:hypothetical protein